MVPKLGPVNYHKVVQVFTYNLPCFFQPMYSADFVTNNVTRSLVMFILPLPFRFPPANSPVLPSNALFPRSNSQLPRSPHSSPSITSSNFCLPVPVRHIVLLLSFHLQLVLYVLQIVVLLVLLFFTSSSCLPSLYNSFSTFCTLMTSSSCSSHPHPHFYPSLHVPLPLVLSPFSLELTIYPQK